MPRTVRIWDLPPVSTLAPSRVVAAGPGPGSEPTGEPAGGLAEGEGRGGAEGEGRGGGARGLARLFVSMRTHTDTAKAGNPRARAGGRHRLTSDMYGQHQ